MERLTREKDNYECRVSGGCPAEDWMFDLYGKCPEKNICKSCPFEKYINKLAEIEDKQGSDLIERQAVYLALVKKGQASKRYRLSETWELNEAEIREALEALPSA